MNHFLPIYGKNQQKWLSVEIIEKIMNKKLIEDAILSAISLISNELDAIIVDDLRSEFELTLNELNLALIEIAKE